MSDASNEACGTFQPLDAPFYMEIDKDVWHISEFGFDSMYLVIGDERAALIDTGTGLFDLTALVSQITDKPYEVYLTHGHVDHVGGMHQFERAYLHEADFAAARSVKRQDRINYMSIMLAMCAGIYDVDEGDVIEDAYDTELIPITGGDIIDLGGRTLEVIDTPGHTPGSISFLDRTSDILFSGDCCNSNTLVAPGGAPALLGIADSRNTISALLATAERLRALRDAGAFSRNYNGHVGYARYLAFAPQHPRVIDDCISVCQEILDGTATPREQMNFDGTASVLVAATDVMQIQYEAWQVR